MTSRGRIFAIAIACAAAVVAGVYGIYRIWPVQNASLVSPLAGYDSLLPVAPVSHPVHPSTDGYVGSSACKKCHAEICETFGQHPMGKSASLTPGPADLEDFSAAKSEFAGKNGVRYKVERISGQVFHHEIAT